MEFRTLEFSSLLLFTDIISMDKIGRNLIGRILVKVPNFFHSVKDDVSYNSIYEVLTEIYLYTGNCTCFCLDCLPIHILS